MVMKLKKINRILPIYVSCRRGFGVEGLKKTGFLVISPYIGGWWIGRILRECCRWIGLPEKLLYSRKIIRIKPERLIIQDPLITKEYLIWLKYSLPNAEFAFEYGNLIGRAKHLFPDEIPKGISITTYDKADSQRYNISFRSGHEYFSCFIGKKKAKKYDVFFAGADKGRGELLLEIKKRLEELGLKTKFIITSDGLFARKKMYHSTRISYKKIIDYNSKSRAILNVVLPGQHGATMRDFESIFNEIKLITTNQNIKEFDFYKEQNVFIWGESNISDLSNFLYTPFESIEKATLEYHLLDTLYKSRENLC